MAGHNIQGENPYLTLTGTESSTDPCGIREKAGNFELYDVSTDTAKLTVAVSSGDATVGGGLTVTTAKTDGQIMVPFAPGIPISGTWTITNASNVITNTRTAATATNYFAIPIELPARTTATKGVKIKALTASYVTTGGASSDIIQFMFQKQTLPVDGSGATGSIVAGDSDADYDTNHNTDAKRYAANSHTLTVTIPTGEQAYIAEDEQWYVMIKVTDAASADLAFALTGMVLDCDFASY